MLNLIAIIKTKSRKLKCLIPFCSSVRKQETFTKIYDSAKISECTIIEIKPKTISFICACGRKDEKDVTVFCHKAKCRWCSYEEYSKKYRKYSYSEIIEVSINKNRKLITTQEEYDKKSSKIKFECSCGSIVVSDTSMFMRTIGCSNCKGKVTKHPTTYKFEYVKEYIENLGFVLLDEEYVNCDSPLKLICPNGHLFDMDFYHFKNRGQRCHQCWFDTDKSGANSPSWKGDLVSQNIRERKTNEYNEWREAVYKKDNFTCACCKTKGGRLCAHHLKSFAKFPELRLDVNNGITLCEDCHSSYSENGFHKLYGTVSFTEEDFYEFMKIFAKEKQEM